MNQLHNHSILRKSIRSSYVHISILTLGATPYESMTSSGWGKLAEFFQPRAEFFQPLTEFFQPRAEKIQPNYPVILRSKSSESRIEIRELECN